MKKTAAPLLFLAVIVTLFSCKKEKDGIDHSPRLILKFKFDSTQARLNNVGLPQAIPAGHAGQSPVFNKMSAHYVELAPTATTALGAGAVIYYAPETFAGGPKAIDFERSFFAGDNQLFFSAPIKDITPGEYEWLRVSLAYQNFDVKFYIDTVVSTPGGPVTIKQEFPATAAGFIGFNTYIKNLLIKTQSIPVNANKPQGFWAFETVVNYGGINYPFTSSGQAPAGATTVPNPIFATSPIPAGSCVVTAAFAPGKLRITGTETSDIVIEVSLSTNKSFEWTEVVADGKWEPAKGEGVTDMGIRGMIPRIQ
ncbi:MAG TPA: hypothetical protein VGO58_07910 [Chitinophagaceae bacterium]|jgi:hypothetical protein|nr:hypothetical protein [Chitinophagaceae bacterium]